MVRNRAMMPCCLSIATEMQVPVAIEQMVISRMPGTT